MRNIRLHNPLRRLATWLAIYCALRLTIVMGVPLYVVQREWLGSLRKMCLTYNDLCVDVRVERNKVGGLWYGYGVYYTSKKGAAGGLRDLVTRDVPAAAETDWKSPWRYVGIRVADAE